MTFATNSINDPNVSPAASQAEPDEENVKDPAAAEKTGKPDPEEEEEKDDYNETYGDLDDGHNDLATPDAGQGVDNLE